MSTRTIIEINHDHLRWLVDTDPENTLRFLRSLGLSLGQAQEPIPEGIRILGQRHHSTTLKLTVK